MICRGEECNRTLVSPSIYYANPDAQPEDVQPHRGKGLCGQCISRYYRHGDTKRMPNRQPIRQRGKEQRSAEETLEDWVMLRDDHSLEQAAARMGMSVSGLSKALERARRRGDERGNVPGVKHRSMAA